MPGRDTQTRLLRLWPWPWPGYYEDAPAHQNELLGQGFQKLQHEQDREKDRQAHWHTDKCDWSRGELERMYYLLTNFYLVSLPFILTTSLYCVNAHVPEATPTNFIYYVAQLMSASISSATVSKKSGMNCQSTLISPVLSHLSPHLMVLILMLTVKFNTRSYCVLLCYYVFSWHCVRGLIIALQLPMNRWLMCCFIL